VWDVIGAFFLLSSGNVANKYLLAYMSSELLVGIRMSVSGALLLLYKMNGSSRLQWSYLKHDRTALLFIILCTSLIPALLKAFSLKYMLVSKQALLGSIDPFITALYSYIMLQEYPTMRTLCGIILGVIGIVISLLASPSSETLWGELFIFSYPELAILGSVALSRYGWMVVQIMLKKGRYEPSELNSISMLSGGIIALLWCMIKGGGIAIPSGSELKFFGALCYTTLVGNILGYTAYAYCLRRHSANFVALAGLLYPLFAACLSALLGLETLTWRFFVSLGFVFAGMFMLSSSFQRKEKVV
jgi:drug/metabolite transporter (DMT)-like permease